MPIIQKTSNLKLEKPEAAHNAWELALWRLSSIVDLWFTQIARGHYVVSGGNLSLAGAQVNLDATVAQFAGTAAAYNLPAQTAIAALAAGNTYIVTVDNAGALQVSALSAAGLWSGALPAEFVLLGVVYEVEGAWTIHNMPLLTARGKLGGVAALNGVGTVVQEPASKGAANGIASLDAAAILAAAQFGPSSKTLPGYQKMPGGLIVQWGANTFIGSLTVTLPIAYPTAHLLALSSFNFSIFSAGDSCSASQLSTTQIFLAHSSSSSRTLGWVSIGH